MSSHFLLKRNHYFKLQAEIQFPHVSALYLSKFDRYNLYEVHTRNIFPLTPKVTERQVPKLQHVVWAPKVETSTSHPSQAIAFVYENDLYYKPKVESDLVCRITTTGKTGHIYNGIPDWFYSNIEDLISDTIAFSTDGAYLSYLSFNDTAVTEYKYVKSLSHHNFQNSTAQLFLHNLFLTLTGMHIYKTIQSIRILNRFVIQKLKPKIQMLPYTLSI